MLTADEIIRETANRKITYAVKDEMNEFPKSINESADLTRQIMNELGSKTFGGLFGATSPAVTQWINSGRGPIYKIRELLIRLESEGNRNLVQRILIFLCKPFEYLPTKIPIFSTSFNSLFRSIAEHGRETASVQSLFAEISENGKINQADLDQLLEEVNQDIQSGIHLREQVKFLIQQAAKNGGIIELE